MTASEEVVTPTPYKPGDNAVDITPDKDGGVLKEIIKEGEGSCPFTECKVMIHYVATANDGTVLHSSKDDDKPLTFILGKENIIKAWDIGVATMRKGEVCLLTCTPSYTSGSKGIAVTLPEETVTFEITLVDFILKDYSKNKDKGILKIAALAEGKGYLKPMDGALVQVHITGKYEDKIFDDRELDFNLGEGCEVKIIDGIERALKEFTKGEKSVLKINSKYAFKEEGNEEFGIPPNATVEYTVELKNFEMPKMSYSMDADEKLEQAALLKDKATNYFKANKYGMALKFYNKLIDYVDSDAGFSDPESNEKRKKILLAARLNLGLVYLKMNDFYKAKKECDKALDIESNNVKGLFRRGQAYLGIGEPEMAKVDFESVLKIEPINKLAANQVKLCNNKIREQREREKKLYAHIFEKYSECEKESASHYGWWNDEKGEPIITETDSIEVESIEAQKLERRRQLENLKKIARSRKKEREEAENEKEHNDKLEESKEQNAEDKMNEELNPSREADTMKTLGEWGRDERDREPTEFEQENPDILMLNKNDEFKNM